MKMIKLITLNNAQEAHILQGRLENEGIECFLTNENFTNLVPVFNNMLGSGVQIQVAEEDFEKAREIIKDKLAPENQDLVCPYCGSGHVALGMGQKKGLKIFSLLLSAVNFIPMGNMKPVYYCKDCGAEFK